MILRAGVVFIFLALAAASALPNDQEDRKLIEEIESGDDEFEEYFVHSVLNFDGNDDDNAAEDDEEEVGLEPYKQTAKWKFGWKRYPLYIVILAG